MRPQLSAEENDRDAPAKADEETTADVLDCPEVEGLKDDDAHERGDKVTERRAEEVPDHSRRTVTAHTAGARIAIQSNDPRGANRLQESYRRIAMSLNAKWNPSATGCFEELNICCRMLGPFSAAGTASGCCSRSCTVHADGMIVHESTGKVSYCGMREPPQTRSTASMTRGSNAA